MEMGNWSEEGVVGGSFFVFSWLDELVEEVWFNKEVEEDVGVCGDGLVSESWFFFVVEVVRLFLCLFFMVFVG